ncbi:MAG: carboxypeptidase-like regulatory domain-containing protein [Thermoanaerobaculum sp.]|nr:carboxypeptidase-like regulatory domain-containing protein [Thermoanaerobaculum sp.]
MWEQQHFGFIAGTVVDNQRPPLPAVTVTLSGPAMQGTRVAVTDSQGRFRFVPVPPGKDHSLKFELAGFNTLEQTGIIVNLGKETAIAAETSLSQFAEAITVTAEKIVVDTSKSTVDKGGGLDPGGHPDHQPQLPNHDADGPRG